MSKYTVRPSLLFLGLAVGVIANTLINPPFPTGNTPLTAQAANMIALKSIVVNGNTVTLDYEKNFDNCIYLMTQDLKMAHTKNLFCANKGPVTVPLSDMNTLFAVGRAYILCNPANYISCAKGMAVQGQTSLPSSSAKPIDYCRDQGGDGFCKERNKVCKNISTEPYISCETPCTNTQQCPTGNICLNGVCSTCTNDSQCPFGNICKNGACTTAAPVNTISLKSVVVYGDKVMVSYEKNFDTCVHLLTSDKKITHAQNFFCVNSGLITVALKDMNTLFGVGKSFVLCHGNNYNVCSGAVVSKQGEVFSSSSSTSSISTKSKGSLFVTHDLLIRSRQLLGSALGEDILRLQLRAETEDVDVTNLQFNSSGSLATSVDRLELYKLGATTPFATATTGGCGADDVLSTNKGMTIAAFCTSMQSQQLVVPKWQSQVILVRPRLKSDEQGAVSKEAIQIWITKQAVSNNVIGSGAVRARGLQSNTNLSANNGNTVADGEIFIGTDTAAANANIVGPMSQSTLSKIVSIANGNPDTDNTNVPTGISPFGQFTFSTAANTNTLSGLNKVAFSGMIFNVNATNVALRASDFKFYNKADSWNKTNCAAYTTAGRIITGTASGSFFVACNGLRSSVVDVRIPSGASVTFVLEGNITNSKVGTSTSTLQASLQNFNTLSNTSYGVTPTSNSHISWLDEDASATTSFKWIEYGDGTIKSTAYRS